MSLEQKSWPLKFVNTNMIHGIAHTDEKSDTLLGELCDCEDWSHQKGIKLNSTGLYP